MSVTKAQKRLLTLLLKGPVERPEGFGVGSHGWDLMTAALGNQGLIVVEYDNDRRAFATLTAEGERLAPALIAPYVPPVKKIRYPKAMKLGDMPQHIQDKYFAELAVRKLLDLKNNGG